MLRWLSWSAPRLHPVYMKHHDAGHYAKSLFFGAGGPTRTGDLLITNQLLYQLSYTSAPGPAALHGETRAHYSLARPAVGRAHSLSRSGGMRAPRWCRRMQTSCLSPHVAAAPRRAAPARAQRGTPDPADRSACWAAASGARERER